MAIPSFSSHSHFRAGMKQKPSFYKKYDGMILGGIAVLLVPMDPAAEQPVRERLLFHAAYCDGSPHHHVVWHRHVVEGVHRFSVLILSYSGQHSCRCKSTR